MTLSMGVIEALATGSLPDQEWSVDDDLCDCTYQRYGMWTNPYLGETLEVRLCCMWAELEKMFPQFVRHVPAFKDYNRNEWVTEVADWNGETAMPAALWHRHLARKLDISIAEARALSLPPPAGQPRKPQIPFVLLDGGNEILFDLGSWKLL